MSQSAIYLPDLPMPDVVEQVDFESIYADMANQFNGYQPLTFDADKRPVITEAVLVENGNGEKVWQMPADEQQGLFYLQLDSDPNARQMQIFAYREMLLRQRVNDGAHSVMVAYASGGDLDNMAADFGVVRLPNETDERLRLRRQMALEAITTAGARGAYEYHVLSVTTDIVGVYIDRPEFDRVLPDDGQIVLNVLHDARIESPLPGDVAVVLLLTADADVDAVTSAVADALNDEYVRPVTDTPHVQLGEVIEYELDVTIWCYPGPGAEPALTLARTGLQAYVDEHYQLGHDHTISGLHTAATTTASAAIQRVELNLDADIVCTPYQAARCTAINVTLGGRDV